MGNHGFEFGGTVSEFDHFVTSISLFGIVLSNTVFLETSERNLLVQGFGVGGLATNSTLGNGLLGNADLTRTPDDGVLQDGAFTLLSLQGLGDLGKKKEKLGLGSRKILKSGTKVLGSYFGNGLIRCLARQGISDS